ncbi:MAG TPA: pyruvate synthase [Nanoarchaeota archaeon]|nr:pyruvate synthase [Nanoarchaeota archaeon]
MPKEIFELIIHGRAGQGAKSIAQVIAEAASNSGKYIQTFPSYGAEKTGAPMLAYVRISGKPIKTHAPVTNADIVMIIDPTLADSVNVKGAIMENGMLLVNTTKPASAITEKLKCRCRVFTMDASGMAQKILGSNHPNMPMLGAFVKAAGILSMDEVLGRVVCNFSHKVSKDMLDKNISAVREGYEALK